MFSLGAPGSPGFPGGDGATGFPGPPGTPGRSPGAGPIGSPGWYSYQSSQEINLSLIVVEGIGNLITIQLQFM